LSIQTSCGPILGLKHTSFCRSYLRWCIRFFQYVVKAL